MQVVGYVRVSTNEQAASGLGLAAQREAIESSATRLGLPVAEILSDAGVSGGLAVEDRPGLLDAVSLLGKGDVLLVARRDRLGRDVVNVALIERMIAKRGARVVSCAGEGSDLDGPSGMLVRTILDAVNMYEKAMIGLRTRVALRAKRKAGKRAGALPLGYALGEDGQTLVPIAAEMETLSMIRKRRLEGASFESIANELNEGRVRAKNGGAWFRASVRAVLRTAERQAS